RPCISGIRDPREPAGRGALTRSVCEGRADLCRHDLLHNGVRSRCRRDWVDAVDHRRARSQPPQQHRPRDGGVRSDGDGDDHAGDVGGTPGPAVPRSRKPRRDRPTRFDPDWHRGRRRGRGLTYERDRGWTHTRVPVAGSGADGILVGASTPPEGGDPSVSRLQTTDGLTEEQTELIKLVREFVDEQILPVATELEHKDEYPSEIVEGMKEMGIFGLMLPEEYGG